MLSSQKSCFHTFARSGALLLSLFFPPVVFSQDVFSASVTDALFVCGDQHPASAGPCATPPKIISNPSPEYSEQARAAHLEGTVILRLIVGGDGTTRDIQIAKSLGLGLDEHAVAAVRQWKFAPATYQGNPVPVQVSVELEFHLYKGPNASTPAKLSKPDTKPTIENLVVAEQNAYANHDYPRAAELSRQIIEISPNNPNAHNLLAMALLELNQPDAAIEALKKQIEIYPQSPNAYNSLGRVYWQQRKYAEATEQFQTQIRTNPDDPYAHAYLGMEFREQKKCTAALPELEKALTITPNNAGIVLAIGECDLDLGENEKAIENLSRATSMASSPVTWNNAAYLLASHDVDLDLARKWAEMSVNVESAPLLDISLEHLSPAQMGAVRRIASDWDTVGWIHFQRSNLANAETYVRAAWQLYPEALVGDHLAQISERSGRRDEAIREYAMALASESVNNRARTPPSVLDEIWVKLAALAGPGVATSKLIDDAKSDLVAMETSDLPNPGKLKGSADFAIVITSVGHVSASKYLSGDLALKPLVEILNISKSEIILPSEFKGSIVRRGTLTCEAAKPQCKLVAMTADEALERSQEAQPHETHASFTKADANPHVYDNPVIGVRMTLPDGWQLVNEKPGTFSQPSTIVFGKPGTVASIAILQEHLESPANLYRKIVEAGLSREDDFTHTADEDIQRDGISGTRWRTSWKAQGLTYQGIVEFFTVGDQHYRVGAAAPVEVFKLYTQEFEEALRSFQFPALHTGLPEGLLIKK